MRLPPLRLGETRIADGSLARITPLIDSLNPQSILLVTHPEAYENSGANHVLEPILADRKGCRFTDFKPNPTFEDARRGTERLGKEACDLIIALGGGSAIDMAKLIAIFSAQDASPRDLLSQGGTFQPTTIPLVAVPTTAGTGSEATHFAVVYLEGKKHSIAHPSLLPDLAIVDPELTHRLPKALTATTGLDALCQGIESLWSVQSTETSRRLAREAVRLAWTHLEAAVHRPTPTIRLAMCRASHLAGRAINISKTTAPHALSYTLTARCGIPHGHAVALTLGPILEFNSRGTEETVHDPRGLVHVQKAIDEILETLDCPTAEEASRRFSEFMKTLGCPSTLKEMGIASSPLLEEVAEHVNAERLNNNPRRITCSQLKEILGRIA